MTLAEMRTYTIRMQYHRTQPSKAPHPLLVGENKLATIKADSDPLYWATVPLQDITAKKKHMITTEKSVVSVW